MSIPILMFHHFSDDGSATAFPPKLFADGLRHLHEEGFRTLPLSEVAARISKGAAFPERTFAITIDDGFQSGYEHAYPALTEFRMNATLFVAAGPRPREPLRPIEGRAMLNWHQIEEMSQTGIEIGAHSMHHIDLTTLDRDDIEREMLGSQASISTSLGRPVTAFCYPFGRYDRRSLAIAAAHFSVAVTDRLALAGTRSQIHRLERVDAYYLRRFGGLTWLSRPTLVPYLAVRAVPRRLKRAVGSLRSR